MRHRLRCIRQRDSMQCGVAALAMICAYHGRGYAVYHEGMKVYGVGLRNSGELAEEEA